MLPNKANQIVTVVAYAIALEERLVNNESFIVGTPCLITIVNGSLALLLVLTRRLAQFNGISLWRL